ncbi:hypothetical protein [Stenotrophomonas rhizophila]|uniref:hypothetical protein n=1 Tax=Stenotrophomonas rhizophila TaxID=216778 RepID=UPI000456C794|nr:hypothetical protein [Stenotrophomonas rhizophila]AHY58444.1 hypothetical protein DX03_07060 [Stenotrophomonas rhizophila]
MRSVRFVSTFFMAIVATACNAQSAANVNLDYDRLILLDAEDLAEAGIGEAYLQLLPELQKYVSRPASVEELIDSDIPRYAILVNGAEYVIYSSDSAGSEDASWRCAAYVFFKVVNDQLVHTDVRFFAINAGNDLGGLFLTPEQAVTSRVTLPRPSDWPYLPETAGPWCGQQRAR